MRVTALLFCDHVSKDQDGSQTIHGVRDGFDLEQHDLPYTIRGQFYVKIMDAEPPLSCQLEVLNEDDGELLGAVPIERDAQMLIYDGVPINFKVTVDRAQRWDVRLTCNGQVLASMPFIVYVREPDREN